MTTTEKTAVVLGATGLVGSELVAQLLDDPDYGKVVTLGRRESGVHHEKLTHHVVDFEAREEWAQHVQGDAYFSAMGTTLKTAGSKEAQWRVDYDYQLWGMQAARESRVSSVALVSSTGAHAKSKIFYSQMKGKLDEAVLRLGFPSTTILRPGMLDGDRKEHRTGEKWGLRVARLIPEWEGLSKVRPVHCSVVARAARAGVRCGPGARIWEARDVFEQGQ